jgi:hypothetical protein
MLICIPLIPILTCAHSYSHNGTEKPDDNGKAQDEDINWNDDSELIVKSEVVAGGDMRPK